jgi:pimeloyl-ACP methyl ester carboxylesterase
MSIMKKYMYVIACLFVSALGMAVMSPKTSAFGNRSCAQETVTVNLSASDLTPYHIVGWLCSNGSLANKTIQLLVPGATYDHTYFDFPTNTPYYSYAQAANSAGFATFSIDKLGTGLSDHPTPELVTIPALAYNVHQIVQDLKTGQIGGVVFKKVILVGHSMGSETIIEEAGTYQDVDGVLATGHIHNVNPAASTASQNLIQPAAFDPKFAAQNYPLGYLTSKPDTRAQLYYYTPDTSPAVIAQDEQSKDLVSDGMLATFFPLITAHTSNNIHVPVMEIVGQDDFLYCPDGKCTSSFVKNNEASYYSADACAQFTVMPETGHSLALHYTAPLTDAVTLAWASYWVGSNANIPAPHSCK